MLDAGDYDRAEQMASQPGVGVDLLIEARLRNGRTRDPDLLRLAQDTVRLQEQQSPRSPAALARAFNLLGALRAGRGEYDAAVTAHQRAASFAAEAVGSSDTSLGDSLEGQALAFIRLEKFQPARTALERALEIRRARATDDPLALARTLGLRALLARYDGEYERASGLVDEARTLWRDHAGEHPDAAALDQVLGDVRFLQGDVAGAREAWSRGLTLATRTLRPDHPSIVGFLRRLAAASRSSGDLTDARASLVRARTIGERELAECDPESPSVLIDLATAVRYDGDYVEARRLYASAAAIHIKCLGPKHSLVASVIYNQATLAAELGDLIGAQRMYQNAMQIWSSTLRPDHPYVARALTELARTAMARGDSPSAERLYQRALSIRRRALGAKHPDVARTLSDLASVALEQGALGAALQRVDEAIAIYHGGGASQDADYLGRVVLLRGAIQMRQRDFTSARASFDEALTIRERVFGPASPVSAEARASAASAQFALENYDTAVDAALAAERDSREYARSTIRFLPERQAMAYAAQRPHGLDVALSAVAADHVGDITATADALVRSRGVVLDELAARAHDRNTIGGVRSSLELGLLKARQRFANLTMRSLDSNDPTLPGLLESARRQKEDAERSLAEEVRERRSTELPNDVGLRDVQLALPEKSALVAFSRYERTSNPASPTRPSYIAVVINSGDASVRAVSLGSARTLEDLISAWGIQARGSQLAQPAVASDRSYRDVADRLRRRIWDPIVPALGGATRVFIVPDGAINFVTFAALPTTSGKYLLETGPEFHYLTAERDLIRPPTTTANKGLLAIGGAAFDDAPVARGSAAPVRSVCAPAGALQFADLPGTRDEILDVARIWRSTGDITTLLSGKLATKPATVGALARRRVVHLATHGFFLDANCRPTALSAMATRAVGGVVSASARARRTESSPLVLSGLALAGANNAAKRPAADDGILTAEEVASLDITGTEWVVLSACDTGLGEVAVGEGVVGLRRAFHIAGAQTVIMSLWSVEDQSARAWMRELYRARFAQHLTTSDAMRTAALRVLAGRRARGESSHPFYWAGFVAVGDWR